MSGLVEQARAYCEAIGRDPDEPCLGYDRHGFWCEKPLHVWMLGASPALARGRDELSPAQVAKLRERR